jgi:hypothetical protein
MCIIAREVGYKSLCFGRIGLAENHGDPFTLNRISVKKGMNLNQFTSLLQLDRGLIRTLRFRQMFLDWLRKTLKPETYLKLRKVFINRR